MKVNIAYLLDGAKQASGIVVVIDVFRAFSVEAYLMAGGAEKLYPVGDAQIAYDYKAAHSDAVLIGERHGIKMEGFDYGNSPSEIEHVDFTGKTVVHTTSAGTQGIAGASHASEILTGSLVNARAIARYIQKCDPEEVTLVCMGTEGVKRTDEDDLCAEYIASILEGSPIDLAPRIERLKSTSGAKFFDPNNHVFPERDFFLCTEYDKFDFVLRLVRDKDGLDYMEMVK